MNKAKVAIYARVSTAGQRASLDTQLEICRKAAALRGMEVVSTRTEVVSGTSRRLPIRAELIHEAKRGKCNTVMVVRLDRFGRSLVDVLATLRELEAAAVNFISIEDCIDFSTPAGRLQAGLLAVFADFEKNLILERAQDGREAAKLKGVKFGRKPTLTDETTNRILELLRSGRSLSEVSKALGINRSMVTRTKKKYWEMTGSNIPPKNDRTAPHFRTRQNEPDPRSA
jgi:putative DNA-invertase from lambdoid prophage Rac